MTALASDERGDCAGAGGSKMQLFSLKKSVVKFDGSDENVLGRGSFSVVFRCSIVPRAHVDVNSKSFTNSFTNSLPKKVLTEAAGGAFTETFDASAAGGVEMRRGGMAVPETAVVAPWPAISEHETLFPLDGSDFFGDCVCEKNRLALSKLNNANCRGVRMDVFSESGGKRGGGHGGSSLDYVRSESFSLCEPNALFVEDNLQTCSDTAPKRNLSVLMTAATTTTTTTPTTAKTVDIFYSAVSEITHVGSYDEEKGVHEELVEEQLCNDAAELICDAVWLEKSKQIALKKLRLKNVTHVECFEAEVMCLSTLCHPNVVSMYDYGKSETHAFIALELVDGPSVGVLLEHIPNGYILEKYAVSIFTQVCRALDACHRHGFVHRDVKLENILVRYGTEHVVLCDFGFAWCAGMDYSRISGSPLYMAPELMDRRPCRPTPMLDSWSAGACLYWMLYGRPPFDTGSLKELRNMVLGPRTLGSSARDVERQHAIDFSSNANISPDIVACLRDKLLVGRSYPFKRHLISDILASERWLEQH